MEGVNPFIKCNKHRMIMFLDELGVSGIFQKNLALSICCAAIWRKTLVWLENNIPT